MDTVERNIEMVRRLEEAFNRRDYATLRQVLAEPFGGHNPGAVDATVEDFEANNEDWRAALPDKRTEIVDIFGEGDRVVARIRDHGTNTGGVPWFGIPPNGRSMDMMWIQTTRHEPDGRIAEMWSLAEVVRLLAQLGARVIPGEAT
jgi:predicted ester cyclase